MSRQLAAVEPPLVVFHEYLRTQPTRMTFIEHMKVGGSDYNVHDENGNVVIKVRAEEWTTRDKKAIYGPQGNELLEVSDKAFSLTSAIEGKRDGITLFKCQRHLSIVGKKDEHYTVEWHDTETDQKRKLNVVGAWPTHSAEIQLETGEAVAHASVDGFKATDYESTGGNKTTYSQDIEKKYHVTVAPGVDFVTFAAVCICLDQIHAQHAQ